YQLGLRSYGVLVKELLTDEAKESGLQVDDLIIMIDNYQIAGFTDIRNALLNYNAGDKVTLMVLRNGQRVSIELKLAQKRTITSTETDD
ncbi:MAG: PDZ domain-containing protein, partial [Erysipelotrichaceae bacterium]|nr:PDZ domain-containing protein [Erysipelotrichaceae bacterium]